MEACRITREWHKQRIIDGERREKKRKSELPSKEDPYRYGSPETASKRQECKYNKWRIQLVQDCANNKNYANSYTTTRKGVKTSTALGDILIKELVKKKNQGQNPGGRGHVRFHGRPGNEGGWIDAYQINASYSAGYIAANHSASVNTGVPVRCRLHVDQCWSKTLAMGQYK
jgi:hypothetical protein